MDLKALRLFVALAEELHFAKAAKRLNTTQSVVSRQIKRLEDEVGGVLFARSTREVALTRAGVLLLQDARRLLDYADRTRARARAATSGRLGRLTIGVTPASGTAQAPRAIRALRTAQPNIEIELVEAGSVDLEAALNEEQIDCAFLHPSHANGTLISLPMGAEPMVALLPEEHPLAGKQRINPVDLENCDVVFYRRRRAAELHDRFFALLAAAGCCPRDVHSCSTFGHAMTAAAAGLGISFLPTSLAAGKPCGTVVRPFAEDSLKLNTVLAFRAALRGDPMIKELIVSGLGSAEADHLV